MANYSITSELNDPGHPFTIALIGAGGTGSQLLAHLGRIDKSLRAMHRTGLFVTMWDDDIVNPANVGRQLFTKGDIGQYKSTVLIERINRFYGTFWESRTEAIRPSKNGHVPFAHAKMIISCVDNVAARRIIKGAYDQRIADRQQYQNEFWLDTGNSLDKGQVILGCKQFKLPDVFDVCPNLEQHEEKDAGPTCSIADALGRQDLFINTYVASSAAQIVWDITYHRKLSFSQSFINLKSQRVITRDKLISDEPNQVQVSQGPGRKDNRKGGKKAGKKSKAAAAKRNVRSGDTGRGNTPKAKEKVLLRNGGKRGKVPGISKRRVSGSAKERVRR